MKNNNSKIPIIIIILAILLMLTGLIPLVLNYNNSGKTNTKKAEIKYNGIFENNNKRIVTIKNNNKIIYLIRASGIVKEGQQEIKDNKINVKVNEDDLVLEYTSDGIKVTGESDVLTKGLYKYTKEYTQENYYEERFGDEKLMNDPLAGVYESDTNQIQIMIIHEKKINLCFNHQDERVEYELVKSNENEYSYDFDGVEIILQVNENNSIELKFTNPYMENANYSGIYYKTQEFTFDILVDNYLSNKN